MPNNLDEIVSVSITIADSAITQTGFGTPMILGYNYPAGFTELARTYTSLAAIAADGFATTHPAYKKAQAVFAQNPKVAQVILGKGTNKPTMIVDLVPVVANSTLYRVTINGVNFDYTSDASATAQEIVEGLTTVINAGSEPVTASEDNVKLTLTSDVVGDMFTLEVDRARLTQTDVTVDNDVEADIIAIQQYNDEWYGLLTTFKSEAIILAAAAYIETVPKMYAAVSADDAILTSSTNDVASDLETAAYSRTFLSYHPKPHEGMDAAWMGSQFPYVPGSSTWKFKTLAGVSVYSLTDTEKGFVLGKHANIYQLKAGKNITMEGWMSSGRFIDVTHLVDAIKAGLQERIFATLANAKKIPYTDPGVAVVQGDVLAELNKWVKSGGLAADPAPVCTVPKVKDVAANDKANRLLPDVNFTATLAGAIHKVTITGVVSV